MQKFKTIFFSGIFFAVALSHAQQFKNLGVVSAIDLLWENTAITCVQCHDAIPFEYQPFPLSQWRERQPYKGTIEPTFILTIPHGVVCSRYGWVVVQNRLITELLSQNYTIANHIQLASQESFTHQYPVAGRVAVIARRDVHCYAHWLRDVLGRLAMLELSGIEYDWLYVPMHKSFMKETLQLWGVDLRKVIEPTGDFACIQADELIVPSLIARKVPADDYTRDGYNSLAATYPPWTIEFLRNKFLPLAQAQVEYQKFCKKVFISRKDSRVRRMINEDEVYALFQAQGFVRYELAKMPVLEQVALFNNADIVVAAHGSGLVNLMFCKPKTRVIEIFQARSDCGFYYLSQIMGLNYEFVKTVEFEERGFVHTHVPLSIIEDLIKTL